MNVRSRLTYANVMSTIAAFGVLAGGGAYAANKIGPDEIASNAVRSKHIKKRQVKGSDLSKRAIPFTGRGSFRSGSVTNPTNDPKTLISLPGGARLVTICSFGGSGNTRVQLVTSGKTLSASIFGGFNDIGGPYFERKEASVDGSLQVVGTGGSTTFLTAWLTIFPSGNTGRPLAMATVTVEHGCGKTTAQAVTTGR